MAQIEIIASAVTKEEQLDIARLLIKAGYTVSITKGKTVDGKGRSYINYGRTVAGEKQRVMADDSSGK